MTQHALFFGVRSYKEYLTTPKYSLCFSKNRLFLVELQIKFVSLQLHSA